MDWLTPSLQEDYDRLAAKLKASFPLTGEAATLYQRERVMAAAALLPGLRLCERKRLLLLSQSSPPMELGRLTEALDRLEQEFAKAWTELSSHHEIIIQRSRSHLRDLYEFSQKIEEVRLRREEAERIREDLEEVLPYSRDDEITSEPLFQYVGYEISAILTAIRDVSYPGVLGFRY